MERRILGVALLSCALIWFSCFMAIGFADKPVAKSGIQPLTNNEKVQAITDMLNDYRRQRATGNVVEPVNCEVLYDMLQAAQALYLEQCPGV